MTDTTLGCPEPSGHGSHPSLRAIAAPASSIPSSSSPGRHPRRGHGSAGRRLRHDRARHASLRGNATTRRRARRRPHPFARHDRIGAGEPDRRRAQHHLGLRRGHARLGAVPREPRPGLLPARRGIFPTPFGPSRRRPPRRLRRRLDRFRIDPVRDLTSRFSRPGSWKTPATWNRLRACGHRFGGSTEARRPMGTNSGGYPPTRSSSAAVPAARRWQPCSRKPGLTSSF